MSKILANTVFSVSVVFYLVGKMFLRALAILATWACMTLALALVSQEDLMNMVGWAVHFANWLKGI